MFEKVARSVAVMIVLFVWITVATAQETPSDSAEGHSVMMVLDVSTSMWGRIEEQPKMDVARAVIADLVGGWDSSVPLGLVAYGHRRKGDCSDIETIMPVGPLDRDGFIERVDALNPRGKTPLTEAVRHAALELGYQDRPATVILVTDGIENCDADPCALARELESLGLAFTTHVIGFDVGAIDDPTQLSCLAEETGGLFLTADTAEELFDALTTVSAIEPAPAPEPEVVMPAEIELQAIAVPSGTILVDAALNWRVVKIDDGETEISMPEDSSAKTTLLPGIYRAEATLAGVTGSVEFEVVSGAEAVHEAFLEFSATVEAPDEVQAGAEFPASWAGPDNHGDHIAMFPEGSGAGEAFSSMPTARGSPVDLTAPDEAGVYQVAYILTGGHTPIASATVKVVPVSANVFPPEQVVVGAAFEAEWEGPGNKHDFIAVVMPDDPDNEFFFTRRTTYGSPLNLTAPGTPGTYEVRYVTGQTRTVLAKEVFEAVEAMATVESPGRAVVGSRIEVPWEGPKNRGDIVGIVAVGAPAGDYSHSTNASRGSPARLTVPGEPGDYDIVYVLGATKEVLARAPFVADAASASISSPGQVVVGSRIKVPWEGPTNRRDIIGIVAAGAPAGDYSHLTNASRGSPARLTVPGEPGDYDIIYVLGATKEVLARASLVASAASAKVVSPARAVVGAFVDIDWEGPGNKGDYVAIVEANAPQGDSGYYKLASSGNPVRLIAPGEPGDYEIRYVLKATRGTLASTPIVIEAANATVSGPAEVQAGAEFDVSWQGPDSPRDYVTITEVGAPDKAYLGYMNTSRGAVLSLAAPDDPGDYELRYVLGVSRKVLARSPISVK